MSSLATHTNKAVRREKTRTLPVSSRSSGPSGGGGDSLESRRLSDSALQVRANLYSHTRCFVGNTIIRVPHF